VARLVKSMVQYGKIVNPTEAFRASGCALYGEISSGHMTRDQAQSGGWSGAHASLRAAACAVDGQRPASRRPAPAHMQCTATAVFYGIGTANSFRTVYASPNRGPPSEVFTYPSVPPSLRCTVTVGVTSVKLVLQQQVSKRRSAQTRPLRASKGINGAYTGGEAGIMCRWPHMVSRTWLGLREKGRRKCLPQLQPRNSPSQPNPQKGGGFQQIYRHHAIDKMCNKERSLYITRTILGMSIVDLCTQVIQGLPWVHLCPVQFHAINATPSIACTAAIGCSSALFTTSSILSKLALRIKI